MRWILRHCPLCFAICLYQSRRLKAETWTAYVLMLIALVKINWGKKSSQSFKSGTCSALEDVQCDDKTN